MNYPYDDYNNGQNSGLSRTGDHDVFVTLAYSYARAHTRMYKKVIGVASRLFWRGPKGDPYIFFSGVDPFGEGDGTSSSSPRYGMSSALYVLNAHPEKG